ncbi:MAG: type II secretion system GspH family protein [Lachnospiraceae bacterium]|nr:type II secretion system GspH family protein [Ruminococcus sp.]MCM1276126.1 type II secretion system GspH family protein [Lachnospiraceae bacterium]
MKRLFSNKSGFSLAEIIVAIAVFAVMMAMIMQMLQLSVAQRSANQAFEKDLVNQENALVVNGKDTTFPEEGGNPKEDGTVNLNFLMQDPDNPTKMIPVFEDSAGLSMDYAIKGTNEENVVEGLNYFVGNYDYDADGTGGGGGGEDAYGNGQVAKYDTRIAGTKGFEDITVTVSDASTVPGKTLKSGQKAYLMTVSASSSNMLEDDKMYSNLRFFFYSGDPKDYTTSKFEKVVESGGEKKTKTYYKKVPAKASLDDVVQTGTIKYPVSKSSDNSIRVGMDLNVGTDIAAANKDGFKSSVTTSFYLIFNGDPKLTAASFGANGSGGVYNASPIYDEITGANTGKKHVNIYGSFPYEVKEAKSDGSDPFK